MPPLNDSLGSALYVTPISGEGAQIGCNDCLIETNSSVSAADQWGCDLYNFIMNTIFIGSVCVIGLLGNIASFAVFCKDTMKTSSSFLFQALSLIDSVLLILVFPLYSVNQFVRYTDMLPGYALVHPFFLVFVYPVAMLAQTATIFVTVLVGVNRYIAVCLPYQAPRLCTVMQAKRQLIAVLAFAVVYTIPKFNEGWITWVPDESSGVANATKPMAQHTDMGESRYYNIIYNNIFYMIFMLSLPLIILTVLNIRLIRALKALSRRRAEMQSLRQQQDNNVTLVLVVVIIVFTMCQAPALVNQILWNTLPDSARECGGFQFYVRPLSNFLVILNSAVNFFIYLSFNTRFRQVLMSIVTCNKSYEKVRTVSNATATTYVNHNSNHKDTTQQSLL